MSPEKPKIQLTYEQVQLANFFIEEAGLHGVANRVVEMRGERGTVREGLARCSAHVLHMTPVEVSEYVHTLLDRQPQDA